MNPIERVIRGVYENCYNIAEKRGNSDYTHSLAWDLHMIFVNQITIETNEVVSDEVRSLINVAHSLDEEFHIGFEELEERQRREATTK